MVENVNYEDLSETIVLLRNMLKDLNERRKTFTIIKKRK